MKVPPVASFLGVVLLILALIHVYLYFSMVSFFGIVSPAARRGLFAAMALLAPSFVLATLAVRLFPGAATQALYAGAAVWFGLALYLTIASTLAWLTVPLRWLPGAPLSRLPTAAALVLYGLALLFSLYNLVNALHPRVNRLTVALEGLPEAWEGRRIAQLSDVHIGTLWNRGYLDEVVRTTLQLQPDLIVITGDLFDGASGFHGRYVEALRRLRAPRGVYFISGNHEVYSGVEKAVAAVEQAGITVLDDRIVEMEGLQLVGISAPRQGPERRPVFDFAADPGFDRSRPSILLYHFPTDIRQNSLDRSASHPPYLKPNANFRTVMEAGVSLQLSGHTHAGQYLPFTWITSWIYRGFHRGLRSKDGFQVFVHSGTGTWGAPFRSGSNSEIALITLTRA